MPGITNPAEPFFKDGVWGWDDTVWRKLALLWGYTDRWEEDLGEAGVAAGHWTTSSTAVPAGYVYKLELAVLSNGSGARGLATISVHGAANAYVVKYSVGLAQYEPHLLTGAFTLKEGDKIDFRMNNCLVGDLLYAGVWGYKMAIAE